MAALEQATEWKGRFAMKRPVRLVIAVLSAGALALAAGSSWAAARSGESDAPRTLAAAHLSQGDLVSPVSLAQVAEQEPDEAVETDTVEPEVNDEHDAA